MAYKVKGFFKGLKVVPRIFVPARGIVLAVVKEHEMEIGYPTDVKHVAHIGWDSAAGNASPSWMNDIMASPNFSSLGNFAASTGTTWASHDFGAASESTARQESTTWPDVPRLPGKPRGKNPEDGSPVAPSTPMDELASSPPAAAEAEAAVGVAANGTQ